jgi:hypothetical protein
MIIEPNIERTITDDGSVKFILTPKPYEIEISIKLEKTFQKLGQLDTDDLAKLLKSISQGIDNTI